ncbi:MAG: hypothetical protein RLZZ352_1142 [Pseudomonadota bacterium]
MDLGGQARWLALAPTPTLPQRGRGKDGGMSRPRTSLGSFPHWGKVGMGAGTAFNMASAAMGRGWASFQPLPDLGAVERADVAAHLQLFAAVQRGHAQGVFLAVFGVQNLAVFPHAVVGLRAGSANDF